MTIICVIKDYAATEIINQSTLEWSGAVVFFLLLFRFSFEFCTYNLCAPSMHRHRRRSAVYPLSIGQMETTELNVDVLQESLGCLNKVEKDKFSSFILFYGKSVQRSRLSSRQKHNCIPSLWRRGISAQHWRHHNARKRQGCIGKHQETDEGTIRAADLAPINWKTKSSTNYLATWTSTGNWAIIQFWKMLLLTNCWQPLKPTIWHTTLGSYWPIQPVNCLPTSIAQDVICQKSHQMYINTKPQDTSTATQLLNQYLKKYSALQWAFHSQGFYDNGFYPSDPLNISSSNPFAAGTSLLMKMYVYKKVYKKELKQLLKQLAKVQIRLANTGSSDIQEISA